MTNYYLDSCIWRDHYENRFGQRGRPLGSYASKLIMKIIQEKDTIIISDLILYELKRDYADTEIEHMLTLLSVLGRLQRVTFSNDEDDESKKLAKMLQIPIPDALHAVIARDCSAILVSQDKHFQQLKDIVNVKRPEELL